MEKDEQFEPALERRKKELESVLSKYYLEQNSIIHPKQYEEDLNLIFRSLEESVATPANDIQLLLDEVNSKLETIYDYHKYTNHTKVLVSRMAKDLSESLWREERLNSEIRIRDKEIRKLKATIDTMSSSEEDIVKVDTSLLKPFMREDGRVDAKLLKEVQKFMKESIKEFDEDILSLLTGKTSIPNKKETDTTEPTCDICKAKGYKHVIDLQGQNYDILHAGETAIYCDIMEKGTYVCEYCANRLTKQEGADYVRDLIVGS